MFQKIAPDVHLITRVSFCCSKKVRKLHLFSTKVAFMRSKKGRKLHLFSTKVAFMRKLSKRQQFTQVVYLHKMLNISKHLLGRNGCLLPTDCQAC